MHAFPYLPDPNVLNMIKSEASRHYPHPRQMTTAFWTQQLCILWTPSTITTVSDYNSSNSLTTIVSGVSLPLLHTRRAWPCKHENTPLKFQCSSRTNILALCFPADHKYFAAFFKKHYIVLVTRWKLKIQQFLTDLKPRHSMC